MCVCGFLLLSRVFFARILIFVADVRLSGGFAPPELDEYRLKGTSRRKHMVYDDGSDGRHLGFLQHFRFTKQEIHPEMSVSWGKVILVDDQTPIFVA